MKEVLTLALLLLIMVTSLAANEAEKDSLQVRRVYRIEGIRVVGESLVKKIGAVDVKEISLNTVNTDVAIGGMIQDMAGVVLTERGRGESVVRFRGFGDRHIRVFIDGMPISSGYFGNYDLHLIAADNVSQIHLIKGPVSHRYGFNTMGGALNIITDNLREQDILNARLQYSSHGRARASFNGSYAIGRSQLYLSSSYLHSPGFVLPRKLNPLAANNIEQGGERRINSDRSQYSANMRLITDIAGIHTFSFASGYSYMPHKGNPPSIYTHDDNRYSRLEDWGKISGSLSAKSSLADNLEIMASAYFDSSEDTYLSYRDANFNSVEWESLIKNNTLGAHFNINHIAGEYFNNDLGFRGEVKSYNRTGGPGYEDIWVDNNQAMTKIYHNLMFPEQGEELFFTIGNALSSYNHSQIDGWKWYWEPQAGIVYRSGNKTLSLAYGISNQFPTMRELFSSSSGNPQLQPENARKAEATFKTPVKIGKFVATTNTTLYYNIIADLISRDRMAYYNIDRMSTYGKELNLNFSLLPFLNHDYEISYLRLDENNSSIKLLEYPELKLRFTHRLKISDKLNVQYSLNRYSESVTYYREQDYYSLPFYTVHDFGAKYLFPGANLTLNITNLLDSYYEPQYGYPAPGREITIAVEVPVF